MNTKFANTINTAFFPLPFTIQGQAVADVLADWIATLYQRGLTQDDPLFPRNATSHDDNHSFISNDIITAHWQSTGSIRKIFKEAFSRNVAPAAVRDHPKTC